MTKSEISLEASEIDNNDVVTEIAPFVTRDDESLPEEEREQVLLMTPVEMKELYARMRLYYSHGIFSFKTVIQ